MLAAVFSAGLIAASFAPVRVPQAAAPARALQTTAWGTAAGAYGAELSPGPDREAEGPCAIAAAPGEGFAVLDPLRGVIHLRDAAGSLQRELSLSAMGAEAPAAIDLALDDGGGAFVLVGRGAGAIVRLGKSGALQGRVELEPALSPATGLAVHEGILFAGFADARAWQPFAPAAAMRPGLPSAGGDCNAALLAGGDAILRCHGREGLREVRVSGVSSVQSVVAAEDGAISAAVSVREGRLLRRLAVRVGADGAQSWADLGPDPIWFTHRAVAFTAGGAALRLSGDASGLRVLRAELRR